MAYTFAVSGLSKLTDKEFQDIPICAREVVSLREPTQIASKEQAWLYELCKDISPDKQESGDSKRPWPRYIPEKSIKKGMEALLIKTWDSWRQESVMLKVPLPLSFHDNTDASKTIAPPKGKIAKTASEILDVGKSLYRRLDPPKKDRELKSKIEIKKKEEDEKKQKEMDESSLYKRFHRSFLVQEQLHRKANRTDPNRLYGYIPKTYEFGFHPKCYFTQEYVDGDSYIDYLRGHNDAENFALFLRVVIFLEKIVHAMGTAHCDIAPRNILVVGEIPILLDFGIVKVQTMEDITLPTNQLGSIAYASPSQLEDSKSRGFQDDIFALGRVLWVTSTRREPGLEAVLAEVELDGKVSVDPETISSLFDLYSMPDLLKGIYQNTQRGTYLDISEFRSDLEALYFTETKKTFDNKLEELEILLNGVNIKPLALSLYKLLLITRR